MAWKEADNLIRFGKKKRFKKEEMDRKEMRGN
jgi:hypothetical protein